MASVAFHLSWVPELDCGSCVARAVKSSVGAGTTATSALARVVPPTPRHDRANFLMPLVSPDKVSDPDVGFVPVNGAPLAVQDWASRATQVRRIDSPGIARSRSEENSTTGAGKARTVTDREAVPPGP